MKLVYTIAGFYRAAGMERILADKANYLAGKGYEVVIVSTDQKGRNEAFPLSPYVEHIDLGINYEDGNGGLFLRKLIYYPLKRWMHRRRLACVLEEEKPDVTISMFCGDEAFLPSFKDGSKKVLEVHFSRYKRLQYGRKGLWALADRFRSRQDGKAIRRFNRFVALTQEDMQYWGNPENGCVIPNFIDSLPSEPSNLDGKTVLAVGRFCYQKAFDRLLKAWAIVVQKQPVGHGWKLRLVGDGEDRNRLQNMADELGIAPYVSIDRPTNRMDRIYRQASVLCLSSRYEGLPMVLLEAQSYGIPAVSFDCKCGPRDVIAHGEDGFLVPEGDIKALAESIEKLILDDGLRHRMGQKARERAARWDKETIMQQWLKLFQEI